MASVYVTWEGQCRERETQEELVTFLRQKRGAFDALLTRFEEEADEWARRVNALAT